MGGQHTWPTQLGTRAGRAPPSPPYQIMLDPSLRWVIRSMDHSWDLASLVNQGLKYQPTADEWAARNYLWSGRKSMVFQSEKAWKVMTGNFGNFISNHINGRLYWLLCTEIMADRFVSLIWIFIITNLFNKICPDLVLGLRPDPYNNNVNSSIIKTTAMPSSLFQSFPSLCQRSFISSILPGQKERIVRAMSERDLRNLFISTVGCWLWEMSSALCLTARKRWIIFFWNWFWN